MAVTPPLYLYNTLTRQKEEFRPLTAGQASVYTCGPTVYGRAHIGNLRSYVFADILHRTLCYYGYQVKRAMNITDVGHLVGDGDEGEDKIDVGARREGKNPLEIAKIYTDQFFADAAELNILKPEHILPATAALEAQIELIKILERQGYVYRGQQAIYFDTSKLADYGKLSGQKLAEKKTAARAEVVIDQDKKHQADFALWFFLTGRYQNHLLHWTSPWGEGFPGWHLECSAISRQLLGQPFDIHTGGVDHIGTHHTNEIAQSEAAFGLPLANVWLHGEHLIIADKRMGKSEGNVLTLDELKQAKINPLAYRYWLLTAHYRTMVNFTLEAASGAQIAYTKLTDYFLDLGDQTGVVEQNFQQKFQTALADDLNMPEAIALTWQLLKDDTLSPATKRATLLNFDQVLGLGLADLKPVTISPELANLLEQREEARQSKNWGQADDLRQQIEALGYTVEDSNDGPRLRLKN